MLHLTRATAVLLCLVSLTGFALADDCTDAPSSNFQEWGKENGQGGFCHTKWKVGLSVIGIQAWATKWQVTGVQLTYSDGTVGPVQGQTNGDFQTQMSNWGSSKLTSFEVATNDAGDGLGGIRIKWDDQTFSVYSQNAKKSEFVNIGAGVFLGASGQAPDFVRAWTPYIMGINEGTAEITSIVFDSNIDNLNKKQAGITSITVGDQWFANNSTGAANDTTLQQSWLFTGQTSEATSTSTSTAVSNALTLSNTFTVKADVGLPEMFSAEVSDAFTTGYQYTHTSTWESSTTGTKSFTWSQGSAGTIGTMGPQEAVHCTASSWEGNYDGGYTQTVTITVAGKDFTYTQHGDFKSTTYTDAYVTCKKLSIKDVPSDAVPTAGTPSKRSTIRGSREVGSRNLVQDVRKRVAALFLSFGM